MKSNSSACRVFSFFLVCALLTLPVEKAAQAKMISTESFMSQHVQTTARDRVMALLQKEEVLKKLQEHGVSAGEARFRVASLSDAEIGKISAKIDHLPAGADALGAILGTALVVFIVLLITDILCVTKIFKFTRCAQ